MTHLSAGDRAPDFELPTDRGTPFRLSAHRGQPVVLFFYPEDDTEGCTTENIEFTQLSHEFERAGVTVLGISPDSIARHCRFRERHRLTIPLAADENRQTIDAYGVWGPKKLYGREFDGLIRTTFLVDAGGRIVRTWRVTRIKGHAGKVLDAARALATG